MSHSLRAYLCLGLFLVALFVPQILGYTYSNGDAVQSFYPGLAFYAHQLEAGQTYLWSGAMLGGFPIYTDLLGGFSSPVTKFFFSSLSIVSAYNGEIFLAIALLLVSSYGAARTYQLSRQASVLTAIAYAFGSHVANWSNNITVANALFLLPLLVIMVRRGLRGSFWPGLIASVATAYVLYSGQPQWAVLSFIGAGTILLIEIVLLVRSNASMRRACFTAAMLLAAAGIGFGAALPQITPSRILTALSARSQGLSFHDAQVSSQTPFDYLWYVLPGLQVIKLNAAEPTLYISILPFLLALLGISRLRKDSRVLPLVLVFALCLIAALRYSPLFWLLHQLPVLNLFRGSNRWMYIGNFALCILAGVGYDAARSITTREFWKRCASVLAVITYGIASVAVLVNVLFMLFRDRLLGLLYRYFDAHFLATRKGGLSPEHYHNSIASLVRELFRNIDLTDPVFLASVCTLAIATLIVRRVVVHGFDFRARAALIVLTGASLILIHPNFTQVVHPDVVTRAPVLIPAIGESKVRYLSVLSGSAVDQRLGQRYMNRRMDDLITFQRDLMIPNIGMQYGFSGIDGFSNLMSRRISRTIAVLGSERSTTGNMLAYELLTVPDKLSLIVARQPVLSMLNVKYLISAYELPRAPGLTLIHTASSTRFNIPIYLYENSGVLPRVYLANSTTFVTETDEEKNFATIIESDNDFSRNTFIECADCSQYRNQPSKSDGLNIREYTDGLLRLTVTTEHGRWLVFSESNLPGWRITIDGQPATSRMTNYLFHGLYIPKGTHDIVFEYGGILTGDSIRKLLQ